MKNVKKMIVLMLAMVMVIGTMGLTAFAAPGDLTVDAKVTVTGFEEGDTVTAFQFITWVDGEGWKLANATENIRNSINCSYPLALTDAK